MSDPGAAPASADDSPPTTATAGTGASPGPGPPGKPAGNGEDGTGEDGTQAALRVLTAGLSRVEEQLSEFHRRSAHRESVIDRLHEENQRLRGGIGRIILEPVVADLVRLYDQLDREAGRLAADGADGQLVRSFAEDVAQILDRCGIELFSAEPGDSFDRERHRPVAVVPCDDALRHNTVAEVIAAGLAERETGRVRRPVHARFYQCPPARDEAGMPSLSPTQRS